MHRYKVNTNGKPTMVDVGIAVRRPTKVRLLAVNPNKRSTVYTDRWQNVNGNAEFQVRLPQSCPDVLLMVKDENNGNPDNIRVTKLKKRKLKRHPMCYSNGRRVREFLKFAQEFSENAGILATGSYFSDGGRFQIDYMPNIVHKGRILSTPARISNRTGRMEIAKNKFARYTVPMRMAILCHEYAHFNMNLVQDDEIEADLNGLKLYLGMGYPVIEAHKSFLGVFQNTPTQQNKERYDYLKSFADNFDKLKYRVCLP